MSQRSEEFLKLYQEARFENQVDFYKRTSAEFKTAYAQFLAVSTLLMVLTAAVGVLTAAVTSTFWTPILAILAVALPAASTALAAYNELLAFERQAKLYEDTELALHTASAESPDKLRGISESDYDAALGVYVNMVESIFQKEQGQWGQLQSQAKTVELPASLAKQVSGEDGAKRAGQAATTKKDAAVKPEKP